MTYDERFTSSLAGGDDARAAAYILTQLPRMARSRDVNRAVRRRRIVAGVVFVIVVAVAAGVSIAAIGRHDAPKPAPAPIPAPPKTFRVVFPEGFTRVQMAARVQAVAKIADREHHGRVKLGEAPYLAASRKAVVRCFGTQPQTNLEGFLFPDTYDFLKTTTSKQLVQDQIRTFCRNWRTVNLAYARSKNLTQYDVLKIASMVEKEAAVPGDRAKIAAVIYNRLHNRMPLGIDATLRYGLHIPPTQSITTAELGEHEPLQHRQGLRDAADPDREPRAAPRSWRPPTRRTSTTSTTCASPGHGGTCSSRAATRSTPTWPRMATGRTRDDPRRAARPPRLALALAADAERRLRGGRARLALHRRSTSRTPWRRCGTSWRRASPART